MAAVIEHHYESAQRQANLTCTITVKPTAGNKLVVYATCLNTITAIADNGSNTGWVQDATLVSTTGNYVWSRQATSTDASNLTTITMTNALECGHVGYMEVSGLDTAGANVSGTTNVGTCTTTVTTTIASVTSTGAADTFVVAALGFGRAGTMTLPSAPSWTNSFTNLALSVYGISSTHGVGQILGTKTQTGSGAVGTESPSWTGNVNSAGLACVVAYKVAAAAGANPQIVGIPSH